MDTLVRQAPRMTIDHVVLDFDGTCTEVPPIAEAYLAEFLRLFEARMGVDASALWEPTLADLRRRSPEAGWQLGGGEASAPAAADPFILAGEAARAILAALGVATPLDREIHHLAYDAAEAAWRDEAGAVFAGLQELGVTLHIVSNSRTAGIERRLDALLGAGTALRGHVRTHGEAAKFAIRGLTPDAPISAALRRRFDGLPETITLEGLARPVKLRRGAYFETLSAIWGDDATAPERTLFCGDIWELDLAMPAALGLPVHLVAREAPFAAYGYELAAASASGSVSGDLGEVLKRVRAGRVLRAQRHPGLKPGAAKSRGNRADKPAARAGSQVASAHRRTRSCSRRGARPHRPAGRLGGLIRRVQS